MFYNDIHFLLVFCNEVHYRCFVMTYIIIGVCDDIHYRTEILTNCLLQVLCWLCMCCDCAGVVLTVQVSC